MIRLIIALIGIFLLWLWFLSPFGKRTKIITTVLAIALSIALASYESYDNKPRTGLISLNQINICGLDAKHSYRSDYKVQLCLENKASGTVKRVAFAVTAKKCDATDNCTELETVVRSMPLTIEPGQKYELAETLRFEEVPASAQDITWSVDLTEVKAIP